MYLMGKTLSKYAKDGTSLVATLQPLNSNTSAIFQWALDTLVDSSFLYELIKREEFFVQKELV